MKQKRQVDQELLKLYFKGIYDPKQLKTIKEYLTSLQYRESLNDFLRSDWDKTSSNSDAEDEEKIKYKKFLSLATANNSAVSKKSANPAGRYRSMSLIIKRISVAAILIGLISIAGLIVARQLETSRRDTQWVQLKNEAGKRTLFFLPDSSEIHLGAASNLQYNKNYGISNRQIRLEGEAYFIVNHKSRFPFSVTTEKITTIDIGTEFNIRSIRDQSIIEVTVAKGVVDIIKNENGKKNKITSLNKYEQLKYNRLTDNAVKTSLPDNEAIGQWRNGLLVFRKQTLREVAAELERFYGIQISFANPVLGRILITTTLQNASITEALEIIAITAEVQITKNGSAVLIK